MWYQPSSVCHPKSLWQICYRIQRRSNLPWNSHNIQTKQGLQQYSIIKHSISAAKQSSRGSKNHSLCMLDLPCLNVIKRERFLWTLSTQDMVTVSLSSVPSQTLIPPPRIPFLPPSPYPHAPKSLPLSKISSSSHLLPQAFEEWVIAPVFLAPHRCHYYQTWGTRTTAPLSSVLGFEFLGGRSCAVFLLQPQDKAQSSTISQV